MVHHCDLWDKVYATAGDLYNHKTSAHDTGPDHICPKCGKIFGRGDTLRRHIRTFHEQREQYRVCGHFVQRKDNLARHIRSQHPKIMRGSDDDGPPRKRRAITISDTPQPPQPPPSPQPQSSLQDPPRVPGSSERDQIEDEGESDPNVEILSRDQRHIQDFEKHGKRLHVYNRQLHTEHYTELRQILHDIHRQQTTQYQINFALGFVLTNTITGMGRYYHASNNTRVLRDENYRIVRGDEEFAPLTNALETFLDLKEYARAQRPNSQWVVSRVTNVLVYVVPFNNIPIGEGGVVLPDYVAHNPSVSNLVSTEKDGEVYKDNLCLFRCFALDALRRREPDVAISTHLRNLAGLTKSYFNVYCQESNLESSVENFKGVHRYDLARVEIMFKTRINVYQLQEDGVAELVRRTTKGYELVLYLNIFDKHFSYINDFQMYAKAFGCRTCGSVFTSKFLCIRHEGKCTGGVKFNYPGGVFHPPLNVFEQLEDYGIELPPNLNCFSQFYGTYDIECLINTI